MQSSQAAYGVKHAYAASDSLLMANSWVAQHNVGNFTEGVSLSQQLIADYDDRVAGARPDDGRNGKRALTWALIGILFYPLGAVAMYFGAKGWKKRKGKRGLAIAGFILGTIEVCVSLFLIFVILVAG